MPFKGIDWKEEFPKLLEMGQRGRTYEECARHYGVTRERIRQIFKRFGVDPATIGIKVRTKRSRDQQARDYFTKWGDKTQELYREKRTKYRGKKANAKRLGIEFSVPFSAIDFPTHCPILGIELDYFAEGRQENSVSFDRLDFSKGYVEGNVVVLSWRANRIKNDGTEKEHRLIADYLARINKTQ